MRDDSTVPAHQCIPGTGIHATISLPQRHSIHIGKTLVPSRPCCRSVDVRFARENVSVSST